VAGRASSAGCARQRGHGFQRTSTGASTSDRVAAGRDELSHGHAVVCRRILGRLFIRDAVHMGPAATGLVLAGVAAVAVAAMIVNSALSDRTGDHCLHAAGVAFAAAAGCGGAALLADPYARVAATALVEIGGRNYVTPFVCLAPSLLSGPAAVAAIALVEHDVQSRRFRRTLDRGLVY
jgi:hypothetical protein